MQPNLTTLYKTINSVDKLWVSCR